MGEKECKISYIYSVQTKKNVYQKVTETKKSSPWIEANESK